MFSKKAKKDKKLPKKQDESTSMCESPGFFMFGGVNENDFAQNDLYFVEFNKQANSFVIDKNLGEYKSSAAGQIEMLARPVSTSGRGPCQRYKHSAEVFKNYFVVYGGRNDR